MFGLFKKDPVKKLEKEYYSMLEKATEVQRSGDLRAYAKMVEESDALWRKIEELKAKNG